MKKKFLLSFAALALVFSIGCGDDSFVSDAGKYSRDEMQQTIEDDFGRTYIARADEVADKTGDKNPNKLPVDFYGVQAGYLPKKIVRDSTLPDSSDKDTEDEKYNQNGYIKREPDSTTGNYDKPANNAAYNSSYNSAYNTAFNTGAGYGASQTGRPTASGGNSSYSSNRNAASDDSGSDSTNSESSGSSVTPQTTEDRPDYSDSPAPVEQPAEPAYSENTPQEESGVDYQVEEPTKEDSKPDESTENEWHESSGAQSDTAGRDTSDKGDTNKSNDITGHDEGTSEQADAVSEDNTADDPDSYTEPIPITDTNVDTGEDVYADANDSDSTGVRVDMDPAGNNEQMETPNQE